MLSSTCRFVPDNKKEQRSKGMQNPALEVCFNVVTVIISKTNWTREFWRKLIKQIRQQPNANYCPYFHSTWYSVLLSCRSPVHIHREGLFKSDSGRLYKHPTGTHYSAWVLIYFYFLPLPCGFIPFCYKQNTKKMCRNSTEQRIIWIRFQPQLYIKEDTYGPVTWQNKDTIS